MHQIAITGYEVRNHELVFVCDWKQSEQCEWSSSPNHVQGDISELGRVLMQGSFSVWISHKRGPTRMKELARFKPMQRHLFLYERALLFCKRREEHGDGGDKTPSYSFKHCLKVGRRLHAYPFLMSQAFIVVHNMLAECDNFNNEQLETSWQEKLLYSCMTSCLICVAQVDAPQPLSQQELLPLLLIYYWGCGQDEVRAEVCERSRRVRMSCATWCKSARAVVNGVRLLADDCCGDHGERQGRSEEVWNLVQWQGGSVRGSGRESLPTIYWYVSMNRREVLTFLLSARLPPWTWRWPGFMSSAGSWLISRSCLEVCKSAWSLWNAKFLICMFQSFKLRGVNVRVKSLTYQQRSSVSTTIYNVMMSFSLLTG